MNSIKNFEEHACGPGTSVRELLRRIDVSPYLFQIVVDEAGRLLGTVTDGDIRRAMLHGASLDDVASECMYKEPIVGTPDDPAGNNAKLSNLGSTRSFLPVVDEKGFVTEILTASGVMEISTALVMAGGPGTRLGERTRNTPKPLLPVGGRPILDHVLDALEAANVKRINIAVHYLPEQIEDFIAKRDNKAAIELIVEPRRLGTAGALGLLSKDVCANHLLVVNGDVITQVDYSALYDFYRRHEFDATVAVARHEIDIPFGVIRFGDDGSLEFIEEKPKVTNFIAAGVYYLSPEYMALVPKNHELDMPELLNMGKKIGLRAGLFPIHEYWSDVGRPKDLDAADSHMRSREGRT